jgi:hypothetical protein
LCQTVPAQHHFTDFDAPLGGPLTASGYGLVSGEVETVLTYVVLGAVAIRLLSAARISLRGEGRATARRVFRRIRWRHLWPVPLVLAAVAVVASILWLVPGLSWGWWTAIGGQGNPVTGTSERTTGTVLEWLIPLIFLLLVLPALPLFALAEERMFRRGAEHWGLWRRTWKTVWFGLVHAAIGVPIAVALALSIGGAYFLAVYLRGFRRSAEQSEAVLESTTAHTAYNAFILTTALVLVLLSATGVV